MKSLSLLVILCLLRAGKAFDGRSVLRHLSNKQRAISELSESVEKSELPWEKYAESEFPPHHVFSILSQSNTVPLLSSECREDLEMITKTIASPAAYPGFIKSVLVPMLDSAGKKGPGIINGHTYFAGHYSECTAIEYSVKERDRHFRGAYFKISLDLFLRPNSRNDSCTAVLDFMDGIDLFWELGFCLPSSCSSAELQNIFRPESGSAIDNPVCMIEKTGEALPELDAGFYITVSLMGGIVAVCILAGIVDYFFGEALKKAPIRKTLPFRLFMSCSMYTNIASIFEVEIVSKEGQISCFHCIRFFSMLWVVTVHLYLTYMAFAANPVDVMDISTDLSSEVIVNGFFSVDSFFFMSGVLLTFTWFKSYQRSPKETMSVRSWILYYAHRIFRLSPAFYILVLFYTFVLKQLMRDSPLNMNSIVIGDRCRESWWMEMLYLHNFVMHDVPCLSYSWYLAADMQMYLFTPLLIIPLAIKPIAGFIVAALIFIISTAANIFLVYHYHWPASEGWFGPTDPEQSNIENYDMLMYDSPLIRCQVFIMGMLVGWILRMRRTLKIHPIVYLLSWILALSLMLTVLLGLHNQTNGEEMDIFWRAMYSAFSRPAWALGLTAITVLCYYGYGGPINSFMSWHIWVPLGRLSYSGYLIHIPIIQFVLAQSKDEVFFSNFLEFFTTRVISITVITFFFAVFWSACFEINFGKIEKLLLDNVRAPRRAVDIAPSKEEARL